MSCQPNSSCLVNTRAYFNTRFHQLGCVMAGLGHIEGGILHKTSNAGLYGNGGTANGTAGKHDYYGGRHCDIIHRHSTTATLHRRKLYRMNFSSDTTDDQRHLRATGFLVLQHTRLATVAQAAAGQVARRCKQLADNEVEPYRAKKACFSRYNTLSHPYHICFQHACRQNRLHHAGN